MKKNAIIIVSILVVIGAIAAMIYGGIVLNKKEQKLNSHLTSINFNEFQEKLNNKETFIVVFTQTECSHCAEYKPVLKQVLADYDIYAYELDEKKISKEENQKLKNLINFNGTPTTVFITEGEEKQISFRLIGMATRESIVDRLKAMGYIK